MNNTYNKNFLLLLILFIVASIARVVFDENKYIINIIATINIMSLAYVVYLILDSSEKYLKHLIKDQKNISDRIKIKKIKMFNKFSNFMCIMVLGIGILYIIILPTSIINDIIGLLALLLSIENEYLYKSISVLFYKIK